jgi:hypothetical protein
MKKVLLLTLLALASVATSAFAQSISFGLRAGVNYANASTGSETRLSSKPRLIVGGLVEVEILRPLVFQAGIQFAEKHTTVTRMLQGVPQSSETIYTFNYIEIPVTLKLAFGKPSFQVYGLAGANLGTLLKAVGESRTDAGTVATDVKASLDKSSNALELGGGIGFEVAPHVSLIVDGRYDLSLKDINTSGRAMLDAGAWKPRDLRITAGLVFRIGR